MAFDYPPSIKSNHIDNYHGTKVVDPYRWLEDPHSEATQSWIEAQNKLSTHYLKSIPEREALGQRLRQLWDYPKTGTPFKQGERYFRFFNSGVQNQHVLYVSDSALELGEVLLDPNSLSDDGTLALRSFSVSKDGSTLAYALSESGSDWQRWHVMDVASKTKLDDVLYWSKFSGATWLPDGSGFFYTRYPEPEEEATYTAATEQAKLYFHKLHSDQSQDQLIYARPDQPQWSFHPSISDDEAYLVLEITRGTESKNLIYYRPLNSDAAFTPLIDTWEADYQFLGNDGQRFYFQTDFEADLGRIIAINLARPEKTSWETVVAESHATIRSARLSGDNILIDSIHDASSKLKRFSTQGEDLGELALPQLCSLIALNCQRDDDDIFYGITSFLEPSSSFRFSLKHGTTQALDAPPIDYDRSCFITRQVFVNSKDGTKVPMFLVHHRDLKPDGNNRTLLYGYGGFNIPLLPSFSISRLVWLEQGGVLAVANLRGGGEYGKPWHEAGTVHDKQQVFDDFIACAEYLIETKISSPQKLAIQGGSNGGLLVGACMTQRPELFGAVHAAVGVMDMLRFHKFTIGWAWVSDYGSSDNPEEFQTLYQYSPLHRIKEGTRYPATLITTGDHDDRVVPAHSYKFAATLQAAHAGEAPVLIRIQTKAGHGLGKPTQMLIDEQADIWAFLLNVLS